MAERVRITDVSPRDGLQNEPGVIPTADKVRLVELLCASGVDEVEVTSFVSPRWAPQLGDAEAVCEGLAERFAKARPRSVEFSALVPNEKGLEGFERANANVRVGNILDKASVFTAASETFSRKNTNASIAESIDRHLKVRERLWRMTPPVPALRAYVSCVIACPYEGPIEPQRVADVAEEVFTTLHPDELDLGDTIGAGTPQTVAKMLAAVIERSRGWGSKGSPRTDSLVLHLHDTFGRAAECVKVALEYGVRAFDGAVGGLGGCPYASTPGRRAPGNISTELLVKTVEEAGYETGVDMARLREAGAFARAIVEKARVEAAAAQAKGAAAGGEVTS
jgi:hydroxymethylglutaryl-CoA lyase